MLNIKDAHVLLKSREILGEVINLSSTIVMTFLCTKIQIKTFLKIVHPWLKYIQKRDLLLLLNCSIPLMWTQANVISIFSDYYLINLKSDAAVPRNSHEQYYLTIKPVRIHQKPTIQRRVLSTGINYFAKLLGNNNTASYNYQCKNSWL